MALIWKLFTFGGAGYAPEEDTPTRPSLLTILVDIAKDLIGNTRAPQWDQHAVSGSSLVLPSAGWVAAVQSTAGPFGPMKLIATGTPQADEVLVAYDSVGVATLTFNTALPPTQIMVQRLPYTALLTSIE